ncbi:hypothetical protein Ancab_001470 [Ancistrocladus abbreviatus]
MLDVFNEFEEDLAAEGRSHFVYYAREEFLKDRDHVASAIDCYIRQYNTSEEHAYDGLNQRIEDAWKDVNQEILKPVVVPMSLLTVILNLLRVVDVLYKDEEGFTTISQNTKDMIKDMFIDSIPK